MYFKIKGKKLFNEASDSWREISNVRSASFSADVMKVQEVSSNDLVKVPRPELVGTHSN